MSHLRQPQFRFGHPNKNPIDHEDTGFLQAVTICKHPIHDASDTNPAALLVTARVSSTEIRAAVQQPPPRDTLGCRPGTPQGIAPELRSSTLSHRTAPSLRDLERVFGKQDMKCRLRTLCRPKFPTELGRCCFELCESGRSFLRRSCCSCASW